MFAAPWTVASQAPLFMGFPRLEYWSGLLFPSSGDLPDPGVEPNSPAWQVDSLPLSHLGSPKAQSILYIVSEYICISTLIYVCVYIYIYIYIYTHTHTHQYELIYIYISVLIYTYILVCVYIYIYIYIKYICQP